MNLDKLLALIRLANNNPNDNEANLAARRVCKILATKEFTISAQPVYTTKDGKTIRQGEPKTWNDVKRSNEPAWRSRPTAPSPDMWEDFMRNNFRGTSWVNWDSAPHQEAPEEYDYQPFYKPSKRDKKEDEDWITGKRKRRQELRVCSKCGLETMTFRTDEVPWICNPCHWKEKK